MSLMYLVIPESFLDLFGVKYGDRLCGALVVKPASSRINKE